ncbi:MAG: ribonuclease P protein component [Desulfuromusa sp.]|nr:ribonuclease P protein component [Desulfuromusa sp.]
MDKCYPGFRRLRKSWEYQLVKKMGCKFNTPHFVLLVFENSVKSSRLGVTVSRRVGNSVQRNRLKRVVREFFRTNRYLYPGLLDYSIIAKRGAALLSSAEICVELNNVFLKSVTRND